MTSRIPKFYQASLEARLEKVSARLSSEARAYLEAGGALPTEVADRLSENVIACHGLPLSVALNFRVNGRDVLVPMAVEEPSVVAAASHAAKLVRTSGGFVATATGAIMTGQIQLDEVKDAGRAPGLIEAQRDAILMLANVAIPSMVARGGGVVDLETRVLCQERGVVVVHLYVDVGEAMGANIVDTVAEAVAPRLHELLGGRMGLRILSNLPLRRTVEVSCEVPLAALGEELADAIVKASDFATLDPFRAVTHNKGIMNGVDAVAVAMGQDWRAIEAGAHAYAAFDGAYAPLATWTRSERGIIGTLKMPLAVGAVGGTTRAHPGVRAAFELMNPSGAQELAMVIAAAGLASNLSALRALAGEGIQRGHMRLHARKAEAELRETETIETGAAR